MARNHSKVSPEVAVELVGLARQMRRLIYGGDGVPEWGTKFSRIEADAWEVGRELSRLIMEQAVGQQSRHEVRDVEERDLDRVRGPAHVAVDVVVIVGQALGLGLEQRETDAFAGRSRSLLTLQLKIAKYAQALSPAIELVSAAGIAGTLVYAYQAGISKDDFLAIVTALYFCYEPIKKLGALNNELKRGEASLDRLEVVLHEPVTITDRADARPAGRLRGDVEFAGVSFAYGEHPALRGVSVRIPAGTVCALVGPSGAGKSTFANLVPRFYEVASGRVTIDGLDVRDLRLADLRRNIALVSQDPVLFNETIYHNLLLGRPDATRAEVLAAAKAAHAHEFIEKQPQGYDTVVGERGALLSGGQKQRLAIARAFLRNAPILILDEATSALDSESEAAVQDALKHLVVGKTVLIIAHRFSTIRDASLILVFDRGAIVAQGNHASLYAGNALYRSLYDRQTAGA